MTGSRHKRWFTVRHRKSLAMALAGWMSLSLVFAFWPCCQAVAQAQPPAVHAGDHDHGNTPAGPDPCRAWLDSADAALNTSPDVLLSGFELKPGHALLAGAREFPAVPPPVGGAVAYHPSPPGQLPLYLRIRHLLI